MKTTVVFMLLSLFLISSTVYSQSSTFESHLPLPTTDSTSWSRYESESIYLNGSQTRYTKNKKELRIGYFFKHLKSEFLNCSEESKSEFHNGERKKKRGTLLLAGGGVLVIGSLAVAPVGVPAAIAVFAVGMVPYALGAVKLDEASDHLQKAVWLHNRDILRK